MVKKVVAKKMSGTRKQDITVDRNFDDIAHRFQRNVYRGVKGDIRLAVLERDLAPYLNDKKLSILDAGGGQGNFSLPLAVKGHNLVLCDISSQMLSLAADEAKALGVEQKVALKQSSIQKISEYLDGPVDVVMCHAVLEWLVDPEAAIDHLIEVVKPGGVMSLTFFNVNSIIFKNLLRTNYKKVIDEDYRGYRGSLTPINPLEIEKVRSWIESRGLVIEVFSGIRVVYDYILKREDRGNSLDELLQLELKFSNVEPYRSLGRYIHFVVRRLR